MATQTAVRRKLRARRKVRVVAGERPRLSVFRSSKHIYAQIIDDSTGTTLAAASSSAVKTGTKTDTAAAVGRALAEAAAARGVKQVVFDRGQYKYHGRVKALAEAAREGGLDF
ncbi:50S ribosomal protein L18 [Deinococcus metallilatus]|uniref:Large ribosomal subunit protein uL18 n=2 Tax=Deinococcus TaxID=1298 RepID=A0AAJ5F0D5_9DEIO|nr:50S ribosomal protein L18 [Deinococcus metallilatus]MBB5296889.1 large subunit ribosomal protein L18 [Deinococcus metallilatus]QBY09619.1 50S ribosomal protein L18 [Deinococcus metallilatus]RXJ09110.1 50S ribosomal protein L18 [Deinococcus metallilatus]TLK20895.1 50S ribosomal protein L18 [Deinococcus metallilatus]GMA13922.1 50S ribosomal protein L18 [Deinococcus metallilatus]